MKRFKLLALCIAVILTMAGCGSPQPEVTLFDGDYECVGDYDEMLTPYLWLNTGDQSFSLGMGKIVSYAERGSYEIKDGKLIAAGQNQTYVFEIKDARTLVLSDAGSGGSGDSPAAQPHENAVFVFSGDGR